MVIVSSNSKLARSVFRYCVFSHRFRSINGLGMGKVDFKGVFAAVPTPFKDDEKNTLHYDKLKENILKWNETPLKGYLVAGTNGEGPLLSNEEKLSMIKFIKTTTHKSKSIIAGTTCESTEKTCEMSKAAQEAGADAVLVLPPHYYKSKLTDQQIINHFTKVANSISIPLLIYNNPFTTGIDLSLDIIDELSKHPNICGIKDIDVSKMSVILERTKGRNFEVLAASAGSLLTSLLMGCTGGLNGLSAALPKQVCEVFTLAQKKDWESAIKVQKQLIMADQVILKECGASGLKAALEMYGYYGGPCRKPLDSLKEAQKQKIKNTLNTYNLLK